MAKRLEGLPKAFGQRLQQLRKNAGMTQDGLAQKASIDVKFVSDLEQGRRSPSFGVLQRLLEALDAEPFELFSFTIRKDPPRAKSGDDLVADFARLTDARTRSLAVDLLKSLIRWQRSSAE